MDMETFVLDYKDKVFTVLVYKHMFTPYEMDKKFQDETIYEDSFDAKIEHSVDLGNGNFLLGFRRVFESESVGEDNIISVDIRYSDFVEFYKLSEINLMLRDAENE